jgi:hypothetical protein
LESGEKEVRKTEENQEKGRLEEAEKCDRKWSEINRLAGNMAGFCTFLMKRKDILLLPPLLPTLLLLLLPLLLLLLLFRV